MTIDTEVLNGSTVEMSQEHPEPSPEPSQEHSDHPEPIPDHPDHPEPIPDHPEPIPEACNASEVASSDNLACKRVGKPFEPGNQLWRRRGKAPGLQASRRALREAFHKALTPEAMAACVVKMLDIIESSDKKAAVQAFKVLTECSGLRGDSDGSRAGPIFTFMLPGPGAIPLRSAAEAPVIGEARVLDSGPVEAPTGS